jgi:hypothetical protein
MRGCVQRAMREFQNESRENDMGLKSSSSRGGRMMNMVQREAFAQAVATGLTYADAYRQACPNSKAKPVSIRRMSSHYSGDEWVKKRIAEIKAEATRIAVEKTGIDKSYVIARLKVVVERCMQQEPVIVKGEPVGQYVFNAAGANRALELLGKEIGMFVDRAEVRTGPLENLSDAELVRLAQELATDCGLAIGETVH